LRYAEGAFTPFERYRAALSIASMGAVAVRREKAAKRGC